MRTGPPKCPICRKAADRQAPWHPFCSKRCRTLDLANWADGTYSVPVVASEADEQFEHLGDEEDWERNA